MTTYELELEAEQVDCSLAVIKDVSVYDGELRTDKANLMVIAKMDSSGVPTYLSGVDNTQPLSAIRWTFPTAKDGWYRFNLIRLTLYSASPVNTLAEVRDGFGVITQFATVLYHTPTSQVVKAKTTGTITVQPGETGWQTYWDVVTDLSTLVSYGSIEVLVDGQLIDCYHRDKLRDRLDEINSKPWFSDGKERAKLYEKYFLFDADLNGLQALNAEGRFAEMEEATRQMEEIYL